MHDVKILVAYAYLPHYRLPVVRKMLLDGDIRFTLLAGQGFDESIRLMGPDNLQDRIFEWKSVKNFWLLDGKFLWQNGLIGECLLKKYDGIIFLGNPYFLSTWVAAFLARLAGRKVLFWAHAIIRDKLRDKLKLVFFRLAHGLLLYGNGAKQQLVNHGFAADNIFVIYNSLDYDAQERQKAQLNPEKLASQRAELFSHPDHPVLLFIGRLVPGKQLDYLVRAGAELHHRKMPVNVLFVGDGVEKHQLEDLVKKHYLHDFAAFYGECYDEETLSILIAMSDLCVSPGNVGLTAMHVLNYGTPVITHNNPFMQMPEYEAITPGITGLLYQYGSLDSLINCIYDWLCKNQKNREEIRTECYRVIRQHYNPAFQASAIKSALYKATGQSRPLE